MTRIIGTIRYGVVSLLFCLICFSGISGNFSSAKELSKDLESRAISYDHLAQELMMKMDYDSAYVSVNRGLKCLEGKNAPELMSGLLLCRAKVQTCVPISMLEWKMHRAHWHLQTNSAIAG